MRILLTGGTGFIGNHLGRRLVALGHQVWVPTRHPESSASRLSYPCTVLKWDGLHEINDMPEVDAVFHLAGEGIADRRWTQKRKKALYESRIQSSRFLIQSLVNHNISPHIFISASAVGFYGDRGDEVLTEEAPAGTGFLAELCQDWESAASSVKKFLPQTRWVATRQGVVLSDTGGFLGRVAPLFRMGFGGRLGSGRQWVSWIHIDDLVALFVWILREENVQGIVNAVALNPVTNAELTKVLRASLRALPSLPVPSLVLRVLYGEMADVLLTSQRVLPAKAQNLGFRWRFPDISSALEDFYLSSAD